MAPNSVLSCSRVQRNGMMESLDNEERIQRISVVPVTEECDETGSLMSSDSKHERRTRYFDESDSDDSDSDGFNDDEDESLGSCDSFGGDDDGADA